jgi:hypothetical protein
VLRLLQRRIFFNHPLRNLAGAIDRHMASVRGMGGAVITSM